MSASSAMIVQPECQCQCDEEKIEIQSEHLLRLFESSFFQVCSKNLNCALVVEQEDHVSQCIILPQTCQLEIFKFLPRKARALTPRLVSVSASCHWHDISFCLQFQVQVQVAVLGSFKLFYILWRSSASQSNRRLGLRVSK